MVTRRIAARCPIATLAAIAIAACSPSAAGQGAIPVALLRLPDGGIQPQIAVDRAGSVHVLYFTGEAGNGDLFYTRIADGRRFAEAVRVNSQPGSAIATGNVRGGRLAVGRGGRVHVVWNGSSAAAPRAPVGATPMLYARLAPDGRSFEPQRNLIQHATGIDGGGAVLADDTGRVLVFWHAGGPGSKDETTRRVWLAASADDGRTFARERAISPIENGACGCCGIGALADARGVFVLYRGARDLVHRSTHLLVARDGAAAFAARELDPWDINACPMSTYALAAHPDGALAAWETAGQVHAALLDRAGAALRHVRVPGTARSRKHPAIAVDSRGNTLLAWTESMGWQRGGGLAWQVYDRQGSAIGSPGSAPGVPTWSLIAAFARPDGGFTIVF